MFKQTVFCIAPAQVQAVHIVAGLRAAAFSNAEISTVFLDHRTYAERFSANSADALAPAAPTQSEGTSRNVIDWIIDFEPLVMIPGVDSLIAAGPIADPLRGATVNGVARGLIDFGVPEEEATCYEGRIKDGNVLVSVHTTEPDRIDRAREIFATSGAADIFAIADVGTPEIASPTEHWNAQPTFA